MFAVIRIPNFSLQAVLRDEPAAGPVAITDGESSKSLIFQANTAAASHGVTPGLTASQAMARSGKLLLKSRSLAREKAATEILLQQAYHFSPCIEATDAGVCTMALRGLALGDPAERQAWAMEILKRLEDLGLEARLGFAVTPDLARLATQLAEPLLVVEDLPAFLARLPVGVMNPPPDMLKVLQLWGIRTMGELVALGKDRVMERLGAEAGELFDRVSPHSHRPLNAVLPPEQFSEEIDFENEIETLEPLLNVLDRFVARLTGRLTAVHLVAGELELELRLASAQKIRCAIKIPAPTNQGETLLRSLRTWLETLKTDSPVATIGLHIRPLKPQGHQYGFFETTLRNPNQFFDTIAQLAALCGPERMGSPIAEPTHRPDVFRLRAPGFDMPGVTRQEDAEEYPVVLRRFRPPTTMTMDGGRRPMAVHSRVCHAPVIKAAGPFLSSGQWWETGRWSREEWDIQTADGTCYRIFRSEQGDFMEGVYD